MNKNVICFYCENKFHVKDLVSSKRYRYGKKKCCKSCHYQNLIDKNHILYNDIVITADDFNPNYLGDKVKIKIIRRWPIFRPPAKGENFHLAIFISGADDDYLVKELMFSGNKDYNNTVCDVIQIVKRIPIPITRICLRQMGFRYE